MKLCLFVLLIVVTKVANSKNILFYWGVSGYSHRISVWPLIEKLVENGHKITFISPYESKSSYSPHPHPNITDFTPKNLANDIGLMGLDFIALRLKHGVSAIDDLWNFYYSSGIRGCESLMKNKQVLKWINSSSFDLVILDALYNECGYGLIHQFQAQHIMYSPTSHFSWFKEAYGLVDENHNEMEYHFPIDMNFLQSTRNLLLSLYWNWKRHNELFPKLEPLLKSALNLPNLPSLYEIEKNTSLIFTNTHPNEEFPRSLPPNLIEISCMHCSDVRKPLPKDLEDFIAVGNDGFILLTFGSYASISSLPMYLQHVFFNSMRALPQYQFIVKFASNDTSAFQVPKNVKLLNWAPQQDLIAHHKIKAFIGHGGLIGTHEAVFHSVPMVVIPLFAEQDFNAVVFTDLYSSIEPDLEGLSPPARAKVDVDFSYLFRQVPGIASDIYAIKIM